MTMTYIVGALAVALISGVASQAQEAAPSPTALLGEWSAPCDAWGAEAHCTLDWRPDLHADHITVAYQIRNAQTDAMIFQGRGVYDVGDAGRPAGYWSDSGGAIHPLTAQWDEGVLTTHWGVAGSVQGRTRYALESDGALQVTDWLLREDGWMQFMSVRYERTQATGGAP